MTIVEKLYTRLHYIYCWICIHINRPLRALYRQSHVWNKPFQPKNALTLNRDDKHETRIEEQIEDGNESGEYLRKFRFGLQKTRKFDESHERKQEKKSWMESRFVLYEKKMQNRNRCKNGQKFPNLKMAPFLLHHIHKKI